MDSIPTQQTGALPTAAPREQHLIVPRTARYYTLGDAGDDVREIWFVLHGHGQLAARFIRPFERLADGTRLIVAPEALSRFYLDPVGAKDRRIGATWMTREDRLHEIADYVRYLDELRAFVLAQLARDDVRTTILGFSQGVSTACRWVCSGDVRADRLILWAGPIPPELGTPEDVRRLGKTRVSVVFGREDEYATPDVVRAEGDRLSALGVPFDLHDFSGGHHLDAQLLLDLAHD